MYISGCLAGSAKGGFILKQDLREIPVNKKGAPVRMGAPVMICRQTAVSQLSFE